MIFLLGILALAALAGYLAWRMQKAREEANKQWAAAHGLQYVRQDQRLINLSAGTPFHFGTNRRATQVFFGQYQGWRILAFDYQWTVQSGKSSTTYHRQITAVDIGMVVPRLDLTPDNAVKRWATALVKHDIDFESEDFNKQWRIQCKDLKFAHDVIHPRMMELLMQPGYDGWSFRYEDSQLLTASGNGLKREQILPVAQMLINQLQLFPKFLRDTPH